MCCLSFVSVMGRLLVVVCYLFFVLSRRLHGVCCLLTIICCLSFVACCCGLCVVGCVLFVFYGFACRGFFVVCCLSCVG